MSRKETVGLIKSHWIDILPKRVKYLCQIWKSLESRTPWLKKKKTKNPEKQIPLFNREQKHSLDIWSNIFTYLTLLKKYIWHISVIYT